MTDEPDEAVDTSSTKMTDKPAKKMDPSGILGLPFFDVMLRIHHHHHISSGKRLENFRLFLYKVYPKIAGFSDSRLQTWFYLMNNVLYITQCGVRGAPLKGHQDHLSPQLLQTHKLAMSIMNTACAYRCCFLAVPLERFR